MSKRESSFALLTGILVGAAAGAVAGVMFAPASGRETREMLRKKAEGVSRDLESRARTLPKDFQREARKFKKDSLDPLAKEFQSRVSKASVKANRLSRKAKSKVKRVVRK